jgi:hypothetical protein
MLMPRLTRRRLAGIALLAVIGGAAWWPVIADRPGRLTKANFDRIRVGAGAVYYDGVLRIGDGMTPTEVVALIGSPFNSYKAQPLVRDIVYQTYIWNAFSAEAFIEFGNGRVTNKEWVPLDLSLQQKAQRVWYWTFERRTIPLPSN